MPQPETAVSIAAVLLLTSNFGFISITIRLFMYENADKQRLSLQVRKQTSGTGDEVAFRYAVENGVGVFYWIDGASGYAISGNVDRAQLLKIAHVVYGQLAAAEANAPK